MKRAVATLTVKNSSRSDQFTHTGYAMSKTICDTDALPIAEVADQLSNLVDEITASHKRIVIEKDGVAIATLISMGRYSTTRSA